MPTRSATFEAFWNLQGIPVDAENRRGGGGRSAVIECHLGSEGPARPGHYFVKKQRNFYYRSPYMPWRRTPTVLREQTAIGGLQACGLGAPVVAYCGACRESGRAVLVTVALDGWVDLDERLTRAAPDAPERRAVLTRVCDYLLRFHGQRWRHGCLYPKHIFIADGEVALIDLEKARRGGSVTLNAVSDISRLLRHAPMLSDADVQYVVARYAAVFRGFRALLRRDLTHKGHERLALLTSQSAPRG